MGASSRNCDFTLTCFPESQPGLEEDDIVCTSVYDHFFWASLLSHRPFEQVCAGGKLGFIDDEVEGDIRLQLDGLGGSRGGRQNQDRTGYFSTASSEIN